MSINTISQVYEFFENIVNNNEFKLEVLTDPTGHLDSICPTLQNHFNELLANLSEDSFDPSPYNELYSNLVDLQNATNSKFLRELLSKLQITQENGRILTSSLKDNNEFNLVSLIRTFMPKYNAYYQSKAAYEAIKSKKTVLTDDAYKPLLEYLINTSSASLKTEIMLRYELLHKSGWIEYIQTAGPDFKECENNELKNILINIHSFYDKPLPWNDELKKNYSKAMDRLYQNQTRPVVIEDKGLNSAYISEGRNTSLYKNNGAGMPDGLVLGCPYFESNKQNLYVGWATASDDKTSQNLQWFRHLEGLMFAIKHKLPGFQDLYDYKCKGLVLSTASTADHQDIKFISNVTPELKSSFQLIKELDEAINGFSEQGGRFQNFLPLLDIILVGSETELSFKNIDNENICNKVISILKPIQEAFLNEFSEYKINGPQKDKKNEYISSFCNIVINLVQTYPYDPNIIKFVSELGPTINGLKLNNKSNQSSIRQQLKTISDYISGYDNGLPLVDDYNDESLSYKFVERAIATMIDGFNSYHGKDVNEFIYSKTRDLKLDLKFSMFLYHVDNSYTPITKYRSVYYASMRKGNRYSSYLSENDAKQISKLKVYRTHPQYMYNPYFKLLTSVTRANPFKTSLSYDNDEHDPSDPFIRLSKVKDLYVSFNNSINAGLQVNNKEAAVSEMLEIEDLAASIIDEALKIKRINEIGIESHIRQMYKLHIEDNQIDPQLFEQILNQYDEPENLKFKEYIKSLNLLPRDDISIH